MRCTTKQNLTFECRKISEHWAVNFDGRYVYLSDEEFRVNFELLEDGETTNGDAVDRLKSIALIIEHFVAVDGPSRGLTMFAEKVDETTTYTLPDYLLKIHDIATMKE